MAGFVYPNRIRSLLIDLFRKTRGHNRFYSLGLDAEPALRYLQSTGSCPPGPFQGGGFKSLEDLVLGLENWDRLYTEEDPKVGLEYKLAADDAESMKISSGIASQKRTFRGSLSDDGVLLVCKIPHADWAQSDCPRLVARLRSALLNLGGRNFDLVLVLERRSRRIHRDLAFPRTFVRFVSHFDAKPQMSVDVKGDKAGWRRIYSEFRPLARTSGGSVAAQILERNGSDVLLIRRNDPNMGLFSQFLFNIGWLRYARERDMIPCIDVALQAGGTWNDYFLPNCPSPLLAVGSARSVQVVDESVHPPDCPNPQNCIAWLREGDEKLVKWRAFVRERVRVNPDLQRRAAALRARLFGASGNVLGCLVRGTDYLRMKPFGHMVQPEPSDVLAAAEDAMSRESFDKIFLVSEDESVRDLFVSRFGDRVAMAQTALPKYESGYLAASGALGDACRAAEITRQYFLSILILSRCQCLIAGCTGGSVSAMLLSEGYRWSRIFDLGRYQ